MLILLASFISSQKTLKLCLSDFCMASRPLIKALLVQSLSVGDLPTLGRVVILNLFDFSIIEVTVLLETVKI